MGGNLIKKFKMMHLLSLFDFGNDDIIELIELATHIKSYPEAYSNALKNKTMLMIFEKPSLRTRVSFQVGMHQLGGHTIVMETKDTPLREKESIADTAKASSRYVEIMMARLFSQSDVEELAENATVPVINGLTDTFHPCQILSDMLTIYEKKGKLKGLKLTFVGDGNNNITHDLLLGCSAVGMGISIGCPNEAKPQEWIVKKAKEKADEIGSSVEITTDAYTAAKNADIVYADTWMSYHTPKEQKEARIKMFMPYQVNKKLMSYAKPDAVFMNCLPAMRGYEQTADVIDGHQSIVFDQAENRLHMQKAIILKLMNKISDAKMGNFNYGVFPYDPTDRVSPHVVLPTLESVLQTAFHDIGKHIAGGFFQPGAPEYPRRLEFVVEAAKATPKEPIVGALVATVEVVDGTKFVYYDKIGVIPPYQNNGIGGDMIDWAAFAGAKRGIPIAALRTTREKAHRMYEKKSDITTRIGEYYIHGFGFIDKKTGRQKFPDAREKFEAIAAYVASLPPTAVPIERAA